MNYSITTINNRFAKTLERNITGLSYLEFLNHIINMCSNPVRSAEKEKVPLFNADSLKVPGTIERKADGFYMQKALIIDYDAGVHLADMAGKFHMDRQPAVLYTSFNNGKGGIEKFRAVIPLMQGFEVELLRAPEVRKYMVSLFPGCDPSTFDRGRFFNVPAERLNEANYTWCSAACGTKEELWELNSGDPINVYKMKELYKQSTEREARANQFYTDGFSTSMEAANDFASRKLNEFNYGPGAHNGPLFRTACAMKTRGYSACETETTLFNYATEGNSYSAISNMVSRIYKEA